MLWLTRVPGERLWSPPRKMLLGVAYLVSVVACVLVLALGRIGLFVMYGALTLLAGERIIGGIECWRVGRLPSPWVTSFGWVMLLVANALWVFHLPNAIDTVAAGCGFAGAFLVLAGHALAFADYLQGGGVASQVP